jgi:iron complex outermembrane receptor protein
VYHYAQADAYLYGGEAGFHFHPHPLDWLHIETSYSNTFGTDKTHHDLPLLPSQKLNTTVAASFAGKKALRKISVYLHNQYSLAQHRVAASETTTPAYDLFSAGATCEVELPVGAAHMLPLHFNVAVNNLFNEVYYDHLSRYKAEEIYNMGRNFNLSLNIPLQWKI